MRPRYRTSTRGHSKASPPTWWRNCCSYFIAKGILTLPVASDKALLDMPWGSHVCQFYNGKEELVEMLVPYFKQGLERNEACVWLVGDLTIEEARNALAAVVPDLERYMAKGQMQIRHYTELYTNPNGTVKAPDQLSDQFAAMGSTVTAKGFAGLRASGSVSWVNDEESMSRFMDYETKVNLRDPEFPHHGGLHLSGPGRRHGPVPGADPQSRQDFRQAGRMGARQVQGRGKDRSGLRLAGGAIAHSERWRSDLVGGCGTRSARKAGLPYVRMLSKSPRAELSARLGPLNDTRRPQLLHVRYHRRQASVRKAVTYRGHARA